MMVMMMVMIIILMLVIVLQTQTKLIFNILVGQNNVSVPNLHSYDFAHLYLIFLRFLTPLHLYFDTQLGGG